MTAHPVDLVAVASGAAVECVRQYVGLDRVAYLLNAYGRALDAPDLPTVLDVQILGSMIEPRKGRYRPGPVTFADATSSPPPAADVPALMVRLFDRLDQDTPVDEFVKAFLDLHPFEDGNGRTAWVLHNWLTGSLASPVPLPDYYTRP